MHPRAGPLRAAWAGAAGTGGVAVPPRLPGAPGASAWVLREEGLCGRVPGS